MDFNETYHEEADTLIPLHVSSVCQQGELTSTSRIDVLSKDTDVYVYLVNLVAKGDVKADVWMLAGTLDKPKNISINWHVNSIGCRKAGALLGLHTFTGGDWGGKFAGLTNDRWVQRFLETEDTDIINVLHSFGESTENELEELAVLEKFVCHVYDKKTPIVKVNQLRWELFRTKASEGENLPPTTGALIQHVRRARLAALIGKSYASPCPTIPLPEAGNGWYKDPQLKPVTSEVLPAPESILELVKCQCRGDCQSRQCSCKRNSLPCSPICKCKENCRNCPARPDQFDDLSSDSDEETF